MWRFSYMHISRKFSRWGRAKFQLQTTVDQSFTISKPKPWTPPPQPPLDLHMSYHVSTEPNIMMMNHEKKQQQLFSYSIHKRCRSAALVCRVIRPSFFIFYFTDIFRNKLVSEDEIKIKIKFIRTIFQLN